MNSVFARIFALLTLCCAATCAPALAAEMTFQFINDSERAMNVKLFSRAESNQQWPSVARAYSLKPDAAVQEIKITCAKGEQICWGAWVITQSESGAIPGPNGERQQRRVGRTSMGAGDRGQRSCERCCHICEDASTTPVTKLANPRPEAQ